MRGIHIMRPTALLGHDQFANIGPFEESVLSENTRTQSNFRPSTPQVIVQAFHSKIS